MSKRISQSFKPLLLAFLILGLGVGMMGCKDKEAWQEPAPEEVFRAFLMDWFRGERKNAFEAIVESDRAALMAPLEELQKTPGADSLPEDYQMLVVGRVNNPYDFKSIEVKEPLKSAPKSGQEVELALNFHDGHKGSATMVWNGERWLVSLPIKADDAPAKAAAPKEDVPSQDVLNQAAQESPDDAPDASTKSAPEPTNTNLPTTPSKSP